MFNNKLFEEMVETLYMEGGTEIDTCPNVQKADEELEKLVNEMENDAYDFARRCISNDLNNVCYRFANAYFHAGFKAGMKFHEWVNK